jgi:predicted enzyme related to lactoylglutathione lyase
MTGKFFWYELMTSDPQAARKFYGDVVGWGTQESGSEGYQLFTVGEGRGVASLMELPEHLRAAGVPPHWIGYIAVEDVDDAVEEIEEEEGTVHREPFEIPGVIRLAVVADPQGAAFVVAKGLMPPPPAELPQGTPGTVGWHELYAEDTEEVFDFYQSLFGWTKTEAMDMGPSGVYQMFATGGTTTVGGMMDKPEQMPKPAWLFYFNVPALDVAIDRLNAGGGKTVVGPIEVPGGLWIVQGIDPQGAHFALVAPKR